MDNVPRLFLASALLSTSALSCCFAVPARGQVVGPAKNVLYSESLNSLIRSIIETVLESHIEPPTRQQMILDVIRNIAVATHQTVSLDLATTISNTTDTEQLYLLLAAEMTRLGVADLNSSMYLKIVESAFHASLKDGFDIVSQNDARAEEQLAANRYVGIGVQLNQLQERDGHQFGGVFADGPAGEAGIKRGDLLESVDSTPTLSTKLEDVITMLRGPESTTVTVTVRTAGQLPRKLSLVRRVVPIKSAHLIGRQNQERAILVRFDRITASSLNELQNLVSGVEDGSKPTKTIVLDLRNTLVSDMHYLHLFADGLLDEMSLGQIQSRVGIRNLKTEEGKLFSDRKIAFLVSPGISEGIDLLALAAHEAGLKVVSFPDKALEKWRQPDAAFRNTIPVLGTEYFIQISTSRLLTNAGKRLGPESLDVLKPMRTLPPLNKALQSGDSDFDLVLRNFED